MQSKVATIEEYLDSLSPERRAAVSAVREVILKNLDRDYEEGITYGMIGYYVPLRVYPQGYHCDPKQPLPFAALASQKNYMSLYLMCLYTGGDEGSEAARLSRWFRAAWVKTGKKLDMGKSCIRFKSVDDLALDVIGEAIRRVPARKYAAYVDAALAEYKAKSTAKSSRSKPAARKGAKAVTAKRSTA